MMTNKKTFAELGLSPIAVKAINKKGFEEPTAIQEMTIPVVLQNRENIVSQAQTGTGKTAAFSLPLLELINPKKTHVQALILAPTRELAIQVSEEMNSLRGRADIKIVPIYGGQAITQQLDRLKKGVHIVVGTPGRIIDHLRRKTLNLREIEHLIIDEADELLNMGFLEEVEKIIEQTNPDKRTLLFSATVPKKIKEIVGKYLPDHLFIKTKQEALTANLTDQIYFEVKPSDRAEVLCRIIDMEDAFYGMVFCRTKRDVDSLATLLSNRGYDVAAIHGDISQGQREKTLESFKRKKVTTLVATDVAARGIDVENLTHVINYALPESQESYVHRIGRTGRAGNEGTAITFISPNEYSRMMFLQKLTKSDIKKTAVPEVDEIIQAKKRKIDDEISILLSENPEKTYQNWANSLMQEYPADIIVAAMLKHSFSDQLDPKIYNIIKDVSRGKRNFDTIDKQGKSRLFIALGRKDGINPKKLVNLIASKVPIQSKQIIDVHVSDTFSFVTVPFEKAERIIAQLRSKDKQLASHAKSTGKGAGKKIRKHAGQNRGKKPITKRTRRKS